MPWQPKDSPYKFLATRPEIPPLSAWGPRISPAYEKNWYTNFGPISQNFEQQLNEKWGNEYSEFVLTSSGTASIAAPLIAQDITGPVLLPAFTFPATLSAVKMAGAEPLLMDVSERDWSTSAEQLEIAFQASNAKAAILISPFGLKSYYADHIQIAQAYGATLIIDNAAGLGTEREQFEEFENVFEAFSMHATKPFGIGEGGVIAANETHAAGLRSALNFGLKRGLDSKIPYWGINGKMSEFHAAIGLEVLANFESRLELRQAFAAEYIKILPQSLLNPVRHEPANGAWQVFPVLMDTEEQASRLVEYARSRGMEVRRYYRPSLSVKLGVNALGPCNVSEDLANRMCCFPVYSDADNAEMIDIANLSIKFAMSDV